MPPPLPPPHPPPPLVAVTAYFHNGPFCPFPPLQELKLGGKQLCVCVCVCVLYCKKGSRAVNIVYQRLGPSSPPPNGLCVWVCLAVNPAWWGGEGGVRSCLNGKGLGHKKAWIGWQSGRQFCHLSVISRARELG
jgi:hypothetical protein